MGIHRPTRSLSGRSRAGDALGRCGITRCRPGIPAETARRLQDHGGPVSGNDPSAFRLTPRLKAIATPSNAVGTRTSMTIRSFVRNPNGFLGSQTIPVRANPFETPMFLRLLLTGRPAVRLLPGEPNESHSVFLCGIRVNHGAAFAGAN